MFKKIVLGLVATAVGLMPLLPAVKAGAVGPNLIANPSVESSTNNLPSEWTTAATGTNTTAFNYLNSGRTGTKSLQINMSKRTSGQAQWVFTPVAVAPNVNYTYTDYYKSNVQSSVSVMVQRTDGTTTTLASENEGTSTNNWKQASLAFKTPSNATKVTVYHYLSRVGQLTLDDFSVTGPTPVVPTVNVTAPANGASVSGSQIAITASGTNISGVQFKVDGINTGAEDTTSPYGITWDSKSVSNGNHSLSATARSTTGDTATSTINVNVQNVTAPTVSITSPLNGDTVSGNNVAINANANDAVGVSGVQFKLDGTNLGSEDTTAPYSVNLDTTTASDGTHTLTAVARNGASLTATNSVLVTIKNSTAPPTPDPTNLISNPSAETANGSAPANWSNGSWGTNTPIYTYENTGHTGGRSVKTQITSFSSGDAKWFFNPVNVTAGKTYDYSHWYQTNVTTDVVAQFTDASGNNTYKWLNTIAPSAGWQQFASTFTAPAGTVKVTVLHVLYSVGSVQIDDVALSENIPPTPGTIPNGSLEQSINNLPASWQKGNWGTNTATFEYMNEGHSGSRSAKVTVSNYTDGDAKWFFNPVTSLVPGNQYRFSTWYKTNDIPHAVAMFNMSDGTTRYFGMPNPQPNGTSNWQFYSETFQVPLGTTSVSTFLFMRGNGYVQVDDQSLSTYQPVGFNRPLLTLTFDDGYEENVTNALPVLNQYGFKTTQCYETKDIEGNQSAIDNVLAFKNAGQEICAHTVNHPMLTTVSPTQLTDELTRSQDVLQSITGTSVTNFASPYGDYNAAVNNEIKKYFRSNRTVDEGYNTKDNFDIYRLRVQNMTPTTTLAQVQAWVAQAQKDNTWLILVYHKIADTGLDPFDTLTTEFKKQMQAISNSGITVKTMSSALDEVTTQL